MLNRSRMVAASAWASIREGFVKSCRDGVVTSETYLKLYPFGYYAGKTFANETNDVFYRQRCRTKTRPPPPKPPSATGTEMACADSSSTTMDPGTT
jgi:hypothetical protein